MNLLDILKRTPIPEPWIEGAKIPWDEPGFSRRMLQEHLSQAHDHASRRQSLIDEHVRWIHEEILGGQPARILDLGCGPGFYSIRLARLGHTCVGYDFSPASIEYALQASAGEPLHLHYEQRDLRTGDYGTGFDLAMLIFGEFNAFPPRQARAILQHVFQALKPGGRLMLEAHTFECVQRVGQEAGDWYTAEEGLFSDAPHLCLFENFWDAGASVATTRFFVVEAATARVERYYSTLQGYTPEQYRAAFAEAGFGLVEEFPSLGSPSDPTQTDFRILVGRR